jgi:Dynein heavy chain AAA lid domain
LGATTTHRRELDKFFRKLCSGDLAPDSKQRKKLPVPDRGSLYDYNFNGEWVSW